MPTTTRTITDVPGILVGHSSDSDAITGCTVVLAPTGVVGAVDVRGGGPGTRETDLLNPAAGVQEVHAIALCGGSAFGLAAATGVVAWLHERGYGYPTMITRVPIVPGAVIFDLGIGRSDRWATAELGYAACEAASPTVAEGCVGVGTGASVGKILGGAHAMKSGIGTWSETLPDGTVVAALVVCNAFGDVYDEHQHIIAGARDPSGAGFANTMHLLRQRQMIDLFAQPRRAASTEHTTLAVIATNAQLDKAAATRVALMAHDGLAQSIRPVHTPFDGDSVFVLATGAQPAPHLTILGSIAAEVVATATRRAITTATGMGGLPAHADLPH